MPMSKKCVGGAHDGADVYLDSQANECVSNGGRVEESGSCGSTAAVRSGAVPAASGDPGRGELLLFPLRLLRERLAHSPLVKDLDELNDMAAPEIVRLMAAEGELGSRLSAFFVEMSGTAASMLMNMETGRGGTFTVSRDFVAEAGRLAEEVKRRVEDERLRAKIDRAVAAAQTIAGRSIADVVRILQGSR
jgi:hypothetical protein